MKKYSLFTLLLTLLTILNGCNFSKGAKTDLMTGLTTTYNGFSVENVSLVDQDDQSLSGNEVDMDTRFSIVYEGIGNYTLSNDKAMPGLSLQVTDADGNYILNAEDLFADNSDGFSAEDASVLRGTVTVGNPMKSGEKYHCKIRVFDKNNAEAEIVSELDFTVK
jgi:hypothetical protein